MASTTSISLGPLFQAGGLASGLDTNAIIDKLVQIESQPITDLQKRQSALNSQVSALGDIASKISALDSAAAALGSGGVLGVTATSSNTGFTATPSSSAMAGRYSVQVQQLATAAKARSQAFAAGSAPVTGGTLTLTVMGRAYDPITITDGESLADVASAINGSGAPVSAVILSDGANSYLSLTNRDTGYPLAGAPGDALSIAYSPTGSAGQALNLSLLLDAQGKPAENAQVIVDGLTFTRQNNTLTDVIPGTTLALRAQGGATEDLVLSNDAGATQTKLRTFVDAYNAVIGAVQKQLDVNDTTDRSKSLAGDFTIRNLQASLQQLMTSQVGTGSVRTLADLGVKTSKDGSLSIDPTVLQSALAQSPSALNTIFSDRTQGLAALVHSLTRTQTDPVNGLLTLESQGLTGQSSAIDDQVARMQTRIDGFRQLLVDQFTAMESVVSQLKTTGQFLAQQFSSTGSK